MAKRVVKAEAKRRAREARKRVKEQERTSGGVSKKSLKGPRSSLRRWSTNTKAHPCMKRLFNWAILQLIKKGDVISWEESPEHDVDDDEAPDPGSTLWEIQSSSNSTVGEK